MEIRVLGPLEVSANGAVVPLGTRKQQTVLALLAVNPNRLVAIDEFVDELWPADPPASALANVRGYASGLRRMFDIVETANARIMRNSGGYTLCTAPGELDLATFEALSREGREALRRGDPAKAVAQLDKARQRWRGPMVAGLPRGPQMEARCRLVEQERASITEEIAQAFLALDQPDEAISVLHQQVRLHPLRERAYALLMRALCRTGDGSGALALFAEARKVFIDHLGIEPGQELQQLQRAILRRDRSLAQLDNQPVEIVTDTARTGAGRPRELPPDVGHFVGRSAETTECCRALVSASRPDRRRPAVVVLHGPGGAGKSALAIHTAHRVAGHFPDGQLYIDLFGATPGLRPRATAEVLNRLLRSLGIAPADIPPDEGDAAARLRTEMADKRLLIVLDNADDPAQINTLLPATGSCAVVVTTRRPLAGVDADRRVRVGGLSPAAGVALILALTGGTVPDRASAQRIAELCEYLPLAIRIAAGRLAGRPDLSVQGFVDRLCRQAPSARRVGTRRPGCAIVYPGGLRGASFRHPGH